MSTLPSLPVLCALALVGAAGLEAQDVAVATSADGVPLHYEVHGQDNAGPALVLIHGWSNDRSFWEDHFATLGSTHPVVALDLAGFGDSGTARDDWTVDAFGDDVIAVMDDAGLDRAVLVGFSMGGPVAMEAALDAPDRVIGVVLVDILQDPGMTMTDEQAQGMMASWKESWGDREWVRAFAFTPDVPDAMVDRVLSRAPAEAPDHWWRSLESTIQWMSTRTIPTLEQLEVPLAAINSDRMPTDTAAFQRLVPSFTLRTIEGVGHLGTLWTRPEAFDRHLRQLVAGFGR